MKQNLPFNHVNFKMSFLFLFKHVKIPSDDEFHKQFFFYLFYNGGKKMNPWYKSKRYLNMKNGVI